MQVAHQNDHVTHAVIGGADTIDFGISSSAEFFNILSSTLYKDQILAVVREVLCNAWDAHIEAGLTHLPVQITLTGDRFTVRDYGTGIHRNDMGPIYGTYGNSTKKNDGKQTGGFGLGCKAPFAYTDHFEVISSHDGVRTIYNLSKSSAQAMGKPGIVPIASFPTTESGLQVSIAIANASDRQKFKNLIERIAGNGDMNMMLNGEQLNRIGFDPSVSNYFITASHNILDNAPRIMVRYGNVVYPVDDHVDSISADSRRICNHLGQMEGRRTYRILFQAPPHSISVTPSRESLSMQEHTLKTLKSLFRGFIDMLDNPVKGFRPHCDLFAEATIKDAVQQANIPELLSAVTQLPALKENGAVPEQMFDMETMAHCYMRANYPGGLAFRKKDITWRLQGMADAKLLDRGLVQTYLRAMAKLSKNDTSDWLQRQVIAPLLVRMMQAKIDTSKLYGYAPNDLNCPPAYRRNGSAPMVPAKSIRPGTIFDALPYLRNIVVISSSCKEIVIRANRREAFSKFGSTQNFLFYHVGLKKKERESVLAFFQQSGMVVIDLNQKTEQEITAAEDRAEEAAPRKPVKKGVVSMASVRSGVNSGSLNIVQASWDDAPRIAAPEFVVQVSLRKGVSTTSFDRWGDLSSRAIVALFGNKGGITFNSAIHEKWIAQGAKELQDYVVEKVSAEIATNPRIQEYWAFDVDRAIKDSHLYPYQDNHLAKIIYSNPILRNEFGLVNNLTDTDKKYLRLWKYIVNETYKDYAVVTKVKAQLAAIPLDPINKIVLANFADNPVLELISGSQLSRMLKSASAKPQQVTAAIQLLLIALKK